MFNESEVIELQPAPKRVIDLSKFIEISRRGEYRIGIVKENAGQGFTKYIAGQFILYKPYTANDYYGKALWDEIKYRCQFCTTCLPYIDDKGNLTTASTCVYVPLSIISHEIII